MGHSLTEARPTCKCCGLPMRGSGKQTSGLRKYECNTKASHRNYVYRTTVAGVLADVRHKARQRSAV